MPFGFSVWSWFAKNPIIQGIAAVLLLQGVLWGHGKLKERKGARKERERARRKSEQVSRKLIEGSHEKSRRVQKARDNISRARTAGELPDRVRRRFIKDDGDGATD